MPLPSVAQGRRPPRGSIPVPSGLGKEALGVLQEAAKGDGHIIAGQFDAGYVVMVGGRRFFEPTTRRAQAAYREGMRQLIMSKYVEQTHRDFSQLCIVAMNH